MDSSSNSASIMVQSALFNVPDVCVCVCLCNHKCFHLALTGWSQCLTYTLLLLLPRFGQHRFDTDIAGRACLDLAVEEEKYNVVEYLQNEGGFSD